MGSPASPAEGGTLKARALASVSSMVVLAGVLAFVGPGCASLKGKTSKGVYHTVRPGQTLWRICHVYQVNMQTVCRLNDIRNPEDIKAGQVLFIPGVAEVREIPLPGSTTRDRGKRMESPEGTGKKAGGSSLWGRDTGATASSRDGTEGQAPEFMWPVKGPVTRWFGVSAGQRHDGIDIVAPEGTPVLAAAAGKVIYSDNGISGYGNLVIVEHAGGFTSVYGHNRRNLVRVEQEVKKGQPIAEVGKTGRADGYHLHFEIRNHAKPVDPMAYLP